MPFAIEGGMSTSNAQVADQLRSYAAVLALEGADRFKLKAYRRAAETIEGLSADVADLAKRGTLTELPGIGKAISSVISEIVATGKFGNLAKTVARLSPEVAELAARPRLDPKRVARVYKKLDIHSLRELENALAAGKIAEAFDRRMEFHIRQGLDERPRSLLWSVRDLAQRIEQELSAIPGVTHVSEAGSLRRKQETVGDLNFLVAGKSASSIFNAFSNFRSVRSSEPLGRRERRFLLSSGTSVTLRWTPAKEWGLALILATGSTAHLADLEKHAAAKKLSLASAALNKRHVALSEEASIYAALDLQTIAPELREGRGEVEAAARGTLPALVRLEDLRGDLHMHTTASDGANSLEEMAAAARELGYEYIGITDHSQSLKITNGLTEKRLFQQIKAIDRLNDKLDGIRILKSAEVDILEDGKLDYSNTALKELDLTICSIHSRFALNRQQQTERIMRAMDNRYFNILGHATGRLLLKREGYEIDIERIVQHAKSRGCCFEINSSPNRLDLSDEHARLAKEQGIKIAINTDAHSTRELAFIWAGLQQARRAWLEPGDVLNALRLKQLLKQMKR
jgi:DNA polymerase (family 10)